jgi:hypothetical protein
MRVPPSPPRSFTLPLATLLALGCYNPKIEEGAFLCGDDNACPAGFSCIDMRCFKSGSPTDGGGPDTGGSDVRACTPASGSTGACDPVCQTGCRSTEQCTNNGSSNQCRAATPNGDQLYASCDSFQDACRPGMVCLPEFTETCGAHCYRFCREHADCGQNSFCVGEVSDESGSRSLYKTCSPRGFGCNPTGTSPNCGAEAPSDRKFPAFACYIVSPEYPTETVCECAGTVREGQECERTYECVPGNECIPIGQGASQDVRCRRLCTPLLSPVTPAVLCEAGQTCIAFPNTNRIGYCR